MTPIMTNQLGEVVSDHKRIEKLEKQVEELQRAVYGDFTTDVPAIRALITRAERNQIETNRRLNQLQNLNYVTIAVIVTYIVLEALSNLV